MSDQADERGKALDALQALIADFIHDYEMDDGEHCAYRPNEAERALITDCVAGLTAEEDFVQKWAAWRALCDPHQPIAATPCAANERLACKWPAECYEVNRCLATERDTQGVASLSGMQPHRKAAPDTVTGTTPIQQTAQPLGETLTKIRAHLHAPIRQPIQPTESQIDRINRLRQYAIYAARRKADGTLAVHGDDGNLAMDEKTSVLRCFECGGQWDWRTPEKHAPNCVAAPLPVVQQTAQPVAWIAITQLRQRVATMEGLLDESAMFLHTCESKRDAAEAALAERDRRIAELLRGEFVCQKCGIREDADAAAGDF